MDYEKAYKEALERAKGLIDFCSDSELKTLENVFPELRESEDERVRKGILHLIGCASEQEWCKANVSIGEVQTWLEKQTEQNLANSAKICKDESNIVVVIPKFRVGDVIRPKGSTAEYTIESISGECYRGNLWRLPISCDNDYELVGQTPAESGDIKSILLVHDEILNNLFERYKTSTTFKTLIVNLQNWWNNTRRHLLSFNIEQKNAWSEERMEATQKLHIYISGPISGYDLEERRKAFMEIEERLKAQGYETVNPMKNGLPDEATTHEHMKRDIELLLTCDRIYFMKKWTHSKGCKLEFDVATAIGLPVMFEEAIELTEFCKMITFE